MGEAMLALTFDDGFKTDLTIAMQEQLNRGWDAKGTSYIISSASSSGRLTPQEILQMIDQGWDIQCHTHTHPIDPSLPGHTSDQLHYEMQEVNKFFNQTLGIPSPEHHAYPGGGNTKLVHNVLKRYRKTMRGTQPFFITDKPDWHELPTFPLGTPDTLQGVKDAIDVCIKYGLSMTTYTHEINTVDREETYRAVLDYVAEKKIKLVTLSEMYEALTRP